MLALLERLHGQGGRGLLSHCAMFDPSVGMMHSSGICTEHRNTIQWYNMFYNNIILHIVKLLLSFVLFDVGFGIPLDILFKCYCSTLQKDLWGRRGGGGREEREEKVRLWHWHFRACFLSIGYTLLYTCITVSYLYHCIMDTFFVSHSIVVS